MSSEGIPGTKLMESLYLSSWTPHKLSHSPHRIVCGPLYRKLAHLHLHWFCWRRALVQIRWGEGSKWSLTIFLSTDGLFVATWLGTAYLVHLVAPVFHALEQLGLLVGLCLVCRVNSWYVLGCFSPLRTVFVFREMGAVPCVSEWSWRRQCTYLKCILLEAIPWLWRTPL